MLQFSLHGVGGHWWTETAAGHQTRSKLTLLEFTLPDKACLSLISLLNDAAPWPPLTPPMQPPAIMRASGEGSRTLACA